MFNISLKYNLTPWPCSIYFIFKILYLIWKLFWNFYPAYFVLLFFISSNEFGIRFKPTIAKNYLIFCVLWKSFCFHRFCACDNQKDRNITFMGANTQWTSFLSVNEKWKKTIQSTNYNLAMCTFSPKVLCTFLYLSH